MGSTCARLHEKRYPGHDRNVDALRRKISAMCRKRSPTGDPTLPPDVLWANKIRQLMTERADLGDNDDLELKEDAFQAHESTDSVFASNATVLTDSAFPESIPNENVTFREL